MKAGWILKSKRRWSVTEQGLKAYKGFKDPEKFTSEVRRLYRQWAANRPEPSDGSLSDFYKDGMLTMRLSKFERA